MKYDIHWAQKQTSPEYIFFYGFQPNKDGDIGKSCLSQWWPSNFKENEIVYKSAGHYILSWKAKLFGDTSTANAILNKRFPKEAKELSRNITNFNAEVWNDYKYNIAKQGNYLKFSQNTALRQFLINTGNAILAEANPSDKIWSIGLSEYDATAYHPGKWKGQNLFGFTLMEVRDELKNP